jgi:hypothetical protein
MVMQMEQAMRVTTAFFMTILIRQIATATRWEMFVIIVPNMPIQTRPTMIRIALAMHVITVLMIQIPARKIQMVMEWVMSASVNMRIAIMACSATELKPAMPLPEHANPVQRLPVLTMASSAAVARSAVRLLTLASAVAIPVLKARDVMKTQIAAMQRSVPLMQPVMMDAIATEQKLVLTIPARTEQP